LTEGFLAVIEGRDAGVVAGGKETMPMQIVNSMRRVIVSAARSQ
jgi:hypothetical protein